MQHKIHSAALETVETPHPFPYDRARKFQHEFLNWTHNGNVDVCILQSPTGSGKTAAFKQFVKERQSTLLVYPTNALLEDQLELFDTDPDIRARAVSGDTLERSGDARARELESILDGPMDYDAIITNPDILAAITQDQYIDFNDRLLRTFDTFDGIVYDEFHFYNAFEVSGLLLQMKVLTERGDADVVLSSATPDEDYLDAIESHLDIDTERIRATSVPLDAEEPPRQFGDSPDQTGTLSQFRYQTNISFTENQLDDEQFSEVRRQLRDFIESREDDERAAVIFNSARRSNDLQDTLERLDSPLADHIKTDNGYDTNATDTPDDGDDDEFVILNTTSKGEVGLDYNITLLCMEAPHDAAAFIQRAGRAGRQSPADIYVFGHGAVPWGDTMQYSDFETAVYETIPSPQTDTERIRRLLSLRAAYALWSRFTADSWANSEVQQDFEDIPETGRWRQFFRAIDDGVEADGGLLADTPQRTTRRLLELAQQTRSVLGTLRGDSSQHTIEYPVGSDYRETEYSITSALQQYQIASVSDDSVRLARGEPQVVDAQYRGLQSTYDLTEYWQSRQETLISDIRSLISEQATDIEAMTETTEEELSAFFSTIGAAHITPEVLQTRRYQINLNPGAIGTDIEER